MTNPVDIPPTPALPLAPTEYAPASFNTHNNVLRLFFNRLVNAVNLVQANAHQPSVISFTPTTEPTSPSAGDVYYDSGTNKLRCYNGTIWNDLF